MRFDTSIVIAGLPLTRVIDVASLKVGRTVATSPSVTVAPARGRDRNLQHVLRLLDQRRHLDGEASARAFERAGGDQAVRCLRHRDQLIERDAVALHQHRLGGDLDRLVARAAHFGREDAGRLLDLVLGLTRDVQQRALRQLAGERRPPAPDRARD